MASFIFDGSASVTAAKADNVFITANPALFVSEAQVGANVVLTYSNGTTVTVTGTTLGDSSTALPGVSLASGTFATGATVSNATPTTASQLYFNGTTANVDAASTVFSANSVHAVFGGLGRSDPNDGNDSITVGGKGSFLIYGNAGADTITQTTNVFDSTSAVTVFGGKNDLGVDSITLNLANVDAKMAIYSGEGTDTITVVNSGSNANTAIFGGQGAADSTDLADSITFSGGGVVNIFGNAGNDTINLGSATTGIAAGSTVTVHGGIGTDTINIKAVNAANNGGVNATIVAYGDENLGGANADSISVGGNGGTTVIYGGTAAADANDNNDVINYSGQGTATIFAAAGDDSVTVNTTGLITGGADAGAGVAVTANAASSTTVYGGNGNDTITILNTGNTGAAGATGTQTIVTGSGVDTVVVGNATGNTQNAVSGTGTGITVTDFQVGIDKLTVNNGQTTAPAAVVVTVAAGSSLQQALDAAANAGGNGGTAGTVGVVAFNGDTYVVVNDGTAAFAQATDLAIKLTGVTDAAGVAAAGSLTII